MGSLQGHMPLNCGLFCLVPCCRSLCAIFVLALTVFCADDIGEVQATGVSRDNEVFSEDWNLFAEDGAMPPGESMGRRTQTEGYSWKQRERNGFEFQVFSSDSSRAPPSSGPASSVSLGGTQIVQNDTLNPPEYIMYRICISMSYAGNTWLNNSLWPLEQIVKKAADVSNYNALSRFELWFKDDEGNKSKMQQLYQECSNPSRQGPGPPPRYVFIGPSQRKWNEWVVAEAQRLGTPTPPPPAGGAPPGGAGGGAPPAPGPGGAGGGAGGPGGGRRLQGGPPPGSGPMEGGPIVFLWSTIDEEDLGGWGDFFGAKVPPDAQSVNTGQQEIGPANSPLVDFDVVLELRRNLGGFRYYPELARQYNHDDNLVVNSRHTMDGGEYFIYFCAKEGRMYLVSYIDAFGFTTPNSTNWFSEIDDVTRSRFCDTHAIGKMSLKCTVSNCIGVARSPLGLKLGHNLFGEQWEEVIPNTTTLSWIHTGACVECSNEKQSPDPPVEHPPKELKSLFSPPGVIGTRTLPVNAWEIRSSFVTEMVNTMRERSTLLVQKVLDSDGYVKPEHDRNRDIWNWNYDRVLDINIDQEQASWEPLRLISRKVNAQRDQILQINGKNVSYRLSYSKIAFFVSPKDDLQAAVTCAASIRHAKSLGFDTWYSSWASTESVNTMRVAIDFTTQWITPELIVICGNVSFSVQVAMMFKLREKTPYALLFASSSGTQLVSTMKGMFGNFLMDVSPLGLPLWTGAAELHLWRSFTDCLSEFQLQTKQIGMQPATMQLLAVAISLFSVTKNRREGQATSAILLDDLRKSKIMSTLGPIQWRSSGKRVILNQSSSCRQLFPYPTTGIDELVTVKEKQAMKLLGMLDSLVLYVGTDDFVDYLEVAMGVETRKAESIAEEVAATVVDTYTMVRRPAFPLTAWRTKEQEVFVCGIGFNFSGNECLPCPRGTHFAQDLGCHACRQMKNGSLTYADGVAFGHCKVLPKGARFKNIYSTPSALPGYWLIDRLKRSPEELAPIEAAGGDYDPSICLHPDGSDTACISAFEFVRCGDPSACLGDNTCREGHIGVYCKRCASGYTHEAPLLKCEKCPATWVICLNFVLVSIAYMGFAYFLSYVSGSEASSYCASKTRSIKLLMHYAHCTEIMWAAVDEHIGYTAYTIFTLPVQATYLRSSSRCIWHGDALDKDLVLQEMTFLQWLGVIIYVAGASFMIVVYWIKVHWLKSSERKRRSREAHNRRKRDEQEKATKTANPADIQYKLLLACETKLRDSYFPGLDPMAVLNMRHDLYRQLICLTMLCYPAIIHAIYLLESCEEIDDDPSHRLRHDNQFHCDDKRIQEEAAIANIVRWFLIFVPPCLLSLLAWWNSTHEFEDLQTRQIFSPWILGYKHPCAAFFEAVFMFRTAAVTGMTSHTSHSLEHFGMSMVTVFSGVCVLVKLPFSRYRETQTDFFALFIHISLLMSLMRVNRDDGIIPHRTSFALGGIVGCPIDQIFLAAQAGVFLMFGYIILEDLIESILYRGYGVAPNNMCLKLIMPILKLFFDFDGVVVKCDKEAFRKGQMVITADDVFMFEKLAGGSGAKITGRKTKLPPRITGIIQQVDADTGAALVEFETMPEGVGAWVMQKEQDKLEMIRASNMPVTRFVDISQLNMKGQHSVVRCFKDAIWANFDSSGKKLPLNTFKESLHEVIDRANSYQNAALGADELKGGGFCKRRCGRRAQYLASMWISPDKRKINYDSENEEMNIIALATAVASLDQDMVSRMWVPPSQINHDPEEDPLLLNSEVPHEGQEWDIPSELYNTVNQQKNARQGEYILTNFLKVMGLGTNVESRIYVATASPNGEKLLTAGDDLQIRLWDMAQNRIDWQCPSNEVVYTGAFSPHGDRIVTGWKDGWICVLNSQLGTKMAFFLNSAPETANQLSEDMVSAGADDPRRRQEWGSREPDVKMMKMNSSGGRQTEVSTTTRSVGKFQPTATGTKSTIAKRYGPSVFSACYSRCGEYILTADQHGFVRVFKMLNVWQHEQVMQFSNSHSVHHAVFSHLSPARFIATASTDGMARIYNFRECVAALMLRSNEIADRLTLSLAIERMVFSSEVPEQVQEMICSCTMSSKSMAQPNMKEQCKTSSAKIRDNTIAWDLVHQFDNASEDCFMKFLIFNPPHGTHMYKAEMDLKDKDKTGFRGSVDVFSGGTKVGELHVSFRLMSGPPIGDAPTSPQQQLVHSGPVRSVCFSKDDRYIITSCLDGAVHVYLKEERLYGETPIMKLEFDGPCYFATFGLDSRRFAVSYSTADESIVALFDVETRECIKKLGQQCRITCTIECIRLHKEVECRWVCAGSDGAARLWSKEPKSDEVDVIAKIQVKDVHQYVRSNLSTEQELRGMEDALFAELTKKRRDLAKLSSKLESLRHINSDDVVDTKEADLDAWFTRAAEGLVDAKTRGDVRIPREKVGERALDILGDQAKGQIHDLLSSIDFFQRLPDDDLQSWENLENIAYLFEYEHGTEIVTENTVADQCLVIWEGTAEIHMVDEVAGGVKALGTMCKGGHINEKCLLHGTKNTSTIKAVGKVKALVIKREDFKERGLHKKLISKKRHAIHDGHEKDVMPKPPSMKSVAQREYITKCLKANALLLSIVDNLDETHCSRFIDTCWEQVVDVNEEIISQNEFNMHFYIVKQGRVRKIKDEVDESRRPIKHDEQVNHASMEHVNERSIGDPSSLEKATWFGESCLFSHVPSQHTVKAVEKSVLWVIDRQSFRDILSQTEESHIAGYASQLAKLPMFDHLSRSQRMQGARSVHERIYRNGEILYRQNDEPEFFYMLLEGEVSIHKNGKEVLRKIGSYVEIETFGAMEIDFKEKRQTTTKIASLRATILTLDAASYRKLISMAHEPHAATVSILDDLGQDKASASQKLVDPGVKYKDLHKVARLGCGGFGMVTLVEHVIGDIDPRKSCYALKTISKGFVVGRGCKKAILNEKLCHSMTKSPFIVKLYDTFNTKDHVHFLLEPALGGELQDIYVRNRLYGEERHARYYIGSVALALDHLKGLKIVYRDVKPENIMIHANGRVKIVDFGTAKVLLGRTFTICGTPEFMAPEMMKMSGYDYGIDWWALGIVIHDLMTGHTPFEAPTPVSVFQKLSKGLPEGPMLHDGIPNKKPCEHLIRAMCAFKSEKRLFMEHGLQGIQTHNWFSGFEWNYLIDQTMVPPYLPKLNGPKDISAFAQHQFDRAPEADYHDDLSHWDQDFDSIAEKTASLMGGVAPGSNARHSTASNSSVATGTETLVSAVSRPDINN